jgi:ribosomal protein S18 acetylase RimI-like enzyme
MAAKIRVMDVRIDRHASLAEIRRLFRAYERSLSFPLDFQDFDDELDALPGQYAPPRGALLVARVDGAAAGCVGLRPLDSETCEMKRLYVAEAHRGLGIGRLLAETVIRTGRDLGYLRIRLDTTPEMVTAQALYRRLGFREIAPYTHNPVPGALFLELGLG